eukprot:COSAG01_NODE_3256_length_6345_cov_15.186359_5_plen_63_part_00
MTSGVVVRISELYYWLASFITTPSRLPIADWENFAARRVESAWLAETGAAPRIGVFLRTGKI